MALPLRNILRDAASQNRLLRKSDGAATLGLSEYLDALAVWQPWGMTHACSKPVFSTATIDDGVGGDVKMRQAKRGIGIVSILVFTMSALSMSLILMGCNAGRQTVSQDESLPNNDLSQNSESETADLPIQEASASFLSSIEVSCEGGEPQHMTITYRYDDAGNIVEDVTEGTIGSDARGTATSYSGTEQTTYSNGFPKEVVGEWKNVDGESASITTYSDPTIEDAAGIKTITLEQDDGGRVTYVLTDNETHCVQYKLDYKDDEGYDTTVIYEYDNEGKLETYREEHRNDSKTDDITLKMKYELQGTEGDMLMTAAFDDGNTQELQWSLTLNDHGQITQMYYEPGDFAVTYTYATNIDNPDNIAVALNQIESSVDYYGFATNAKISQAWLEAGVNEW